MIAALFYWTGAASWTVCSLLALWLAAKYLHVRVTEARRVRGIRQRARARLHEIEREQATDDAFSEAMRAAWRMDGSRTASDDAARVARVGAADARARERAARVEANHDAPVNQWFG